MTTVPVLLIVFNRPDTAGRVIQAIRKAKPKHLYVAADGPRPAKENEAELCRQTRAVVLDAIDWECEVRTLFRAENLGCARGVTGAISWFFEQEEMGIILEDDCVPIPGFFGFCETLLQQYKDDERIMQIAGCNIQNGHWRGEGSYYFSRYGEIWGWATWRRAWNCYDFEMKGYASFIRQGGLDAVFSDRAVAKRWEKNFSIIQSQKVPTAWDYIWMYSIWKENGLSIIPNVSFIENIGFDERAVHTKATNHRFKNIRVQQLDSLVHPPHIIPDAAADRYTTQLRYHPPLFTRARLKLQHLATALFSS